MTKSAAKSGNLKPLLERVLADFPPVARTGADPIQFPRWFFDQKRPAAEVESVALFSAMLAYGSAAQFIKKIRQTLDACNWQFLDLICNPAQTKKFAWPAYRLSTGAEIGILASAAGNLIKQHKSLKIVFLNGFTPQKSIKDGLISLQQGLVREAEIIGGPISRGTRHLLPDPAAGGCVKRWQMFLRWLVRPEDGVDMNLWPEVSPALLLIPLDRHISRIARNLGLTTRGSDDWKTAEEIAHRLAEFCPEDPIKYDFSLCHLGIAGECTHGKDQNLCRRCLLASACQAFTRPGKN
ncbi:MAG: TIGR02757 family protein [Candidatus Riflebacteria bacterium GWC2_50_8]|nr:MAG: TIGR02757 family protein [Candidatus Riflebacteria bacterium GWC2_50_8]